MFPKLKFVLVFLCEEWCCGSMTVQIVTTLFLMNEGLSNVDRMGHRLQIRVTFEFVVVTFPGCFRRETSTECTGL